jgi:hypothetical protein
VCQTRRWRVRCATHWPALTWSARRSAACASSWRRSWACRWRSGRRSSDSRRGAAQRARESERE